MTRVRLAYFVSRFPHLYQTFVRREINQLLKGGIAIDVYPITGPRRGGKNDPIHAGTDSPVTIIPASLCKVATWAAVIRTLVRHPGKCTGLVWRLMLATNGHPAQLLKSLIAVARGLAWSEQIEKAGYTHLHAHWSTYPATSAMVVSELTGIGFTFAFHAYDIFATRIMIPEKIEHASSVVVNCRYTRDYILQQYPGTDPRKLVLVYNSLELEAYQAIHRKPNPSCPLILAIGQLVPTKGFADLIDACALLAGEKMAFRLLFAGAGPMLKNLSGRADAAGITDRVSFAGEKTEGEIRELLAQATVVAMPSRTPRKGTHDALPNVIIEALASGVPVVATDVFGIPEVIENDVTGLLVPEQCAPELKAAIARILENPELAHRLAAEGKRRAAELFDGTKNGKRLLELFCDSGE